MTQLEIAWPTEPGAGSYRVGTGLDGLRLDARISDRDWRARTGDGTEVLVHTLPPACCADTGRLLADAANLVSLREPLLIPVLGVTGRDDHPLLVSEFDRGLSVRRLLRLAAPTPEQAVWLAHGLLAALRRLHELGFVHGHCHGGNLRIGRDGRVRLAGWAPGALRDPTAIGDRHADVAAAGVVLRELARAASSSTMLRDHHTVALLAALDTAVDRATLPGAEIDAVAAAIVAGKTSQATMPETMRAELAALVAAATGTAPRIPTPRGQPLGASPTRPPARHRLRPALRALLRRLLLWLAALAVLVAAVLLEVTFLHDKINHDVGLLFTGNGGHPSTAAKPTAPPPVAALAPASDGVLRGVDLRAMRTCAAGTGCQVRVLVRVAPAATPRTVHWTYRVVLRCERTGVDRPGGGMTVPAHTANGYAVGTVALPKGRALAVIAVATTGSARVASPPLSVPAGGGTCR